MSFYYAQFVIVEENQWQSPNAPHDVIREETLYRIQTQFFTASDAEWAYSRAMEMSRGFEDSHNDGPGDRTNFKCMGIYDLDEVFLGERSLTEELDGPYGVDVGLVRVDGGMPTIPSRSALSLFSSFAS